MGHKARALLWWLHRTIACKRRQKQHSVDLASLLAKQVLSQLSLLLSCEPCNRQNTSYLRYNLGPELGLFTSKIHAPDVPAYRLFLCLIPYQTARGRPILRSEGGCVWT